MKVALLFPGQGCQYIGMCQELIQEFSVAAEVFKEANRVLDFDLCSLIFDGNLPEFTLSEKAQPAVVTASYALFRVFEEYTGFTPSCAAGHSLGEISALIAAGALPFSEGVFYAHARGKLMHRAMEEKKGRAGIVVDLEVHVLQQIVDSIAPDDYLTISGYNSPQQFIVAGTRTALRSMEKEVDQAGGEFIPFRMMPMKADAPYHSALMTFLKPDFEEALQNLHFGKMNFDIWSTVTGRIIEPADSIPEILGNQLVLPVRWNQILTGISDCGVDLLIDIGPQQIVRNLIQENPALPASLAFDEQEERKKIFEYFAKEATT